MPLLFLYLTDNVACGWSYPQLAVNIKEHGKADKNWSAAASWPLFNDGTLQPKVQCTFLAVKDKHVWSCRRKRGAYKDNTQYAYFPGYGAFQYLYLTQVTFIFNHPSAIQMTEACMFPLYQTIRTNQL